jgi:hypothetical protein
MAILQGKTEEVKIDEHHSGTSSGEIQGQQHRVARTRQPCCVKRQSEMPMPRSQLSASWTAPEPSNRIRLRNLAWLTTGLFLVRSVHLSHIARKLPLQGQVVSLTNRLRRFLDNPRASIWHYHQPIARQLLTSLWGQRLTLLIDCTALGFNYQLTGIAIAYRHRALPLIWSVHRGKHGMVHAQAHIVGQTCASDFQQNGGLGCGVSFFGLKCTSSFETA